MKNNKRKYWYCVKWGGGDHDAGSVYVEIRESVIGANPEFEPTYLTGDNICFRPATNTEIASHLSEPGNKIFEPGDVFVRMPTTNGPDGEIGLVDKLDSRLDEYFITLHKADHKRFGIDMQNRQYIRLATPLETTAFEQGTKNINDMPAHPALGQICELKQEDFFNTKIWIGDDPALYNLILKKMRAFGFYGSGYNDHIRILFFWDDMNFCFGVSREEFRDSDFREITPADLGIQWPPQQAAKPVLDHKESFAFLFTSHEERRDFIDWCIEHDMPVGPATKLYKTETKTYRGPALIGWYADAGRIGSWNEHNDWVPRLSSIEELKARFFPNHLTTDDVLAGFDNISGVPESYLGSDSNELVGVAAMRITALPPVRIGQSKPLPLPVAPEPLPVPLIDEIIIPIP